MKLSSNCATHYQQNLDFGRFEFKSISTRSFTTMITPFLCRCVREATFRFLYHWGLTMSKLSRHMSMNKENLSSTCSTPVRQCCNETPMEKVNSSIGFSPANLRACFVISRDLIRRKKCFFFLFRVILSCIHYKIITKYSKRVSR
jgi:hypothetical protein